MTQRGLEQVGAGGGILFVLFQLIGQSLIQVGGSEPSFGASSQEVVAFWEARDRLLFNTGSYLSGLSVIPMLGFLASLRGVLRRSEGEDGWLTTVATGAGLLFLALAAGGGFWHLAVFRIDGLDPQIALLLFDLGNFNFATMWVMLGALTFAVGLATLWHRAFPRWLGWMGLIVGIGLVLARIFLDIHRSLRSLRALLGLADIGMRGHVPPCGAHPSSDLQQVGCCLDRCSGTLSPLGMVSPALI